MCDFITLIAPTSDQPAVEAVMDRHARAAHPLDNISVRKVLASGERQYLTTRGHCDCGTILARPNPVEAFEERLAKEASRLARKGWSDVKIARAMEDRRKAEDRPGASSIDNILFWVSVINDLVRELRLPHVGLMVRSYSGAIESAVFDVTRRETPKNMPLAEALASMQSAEVTIFRAA